MHFFYETANIVLKMGLETLKINVYGIAVLFVVWLGSENWACVLIQVHGL
jgi:hypothetical protein